MRCGASKAKAWASTVRDFVCWHAGSGRPTHPPTPAFAPPLPCRLPACRIPRATAPHRTAPQPAVIAVAEKAHSAVDAVGVESPDKAALVELEAAMELVEDSQELMMAAGGPLVGGRSVGGLVDGRWVGRVGAGGSE